MNKDELIKFMSFKKNGNEVVPIDVIEVNGTFILAIYRGKKSDADILIRYRQKLKTGKWSNIRTPKHIHWTVDVLIKMFQDKKTTKQFLQKLTEIWEKEIHPLNKDERNNLRLEELLQYDNSMIEQFRKLSKYGEYNVKFLLLLAKLLMLQEKTNYPEGHLFQDLLKKLEEGEDIFSILQKATFKG